MAAVLVDSNVLLDLITEDPNWFEWSARSIEQAGERYRLVINPVVYSEVSTDFASIEELDLAIPKEMFVREAIPFEAAFLAGKCFVIYRRRGGSRTIPLPDFFIGAHASVAGYRLLTRDTKRYRDYFPKLPLISPG